MVIWQNWDIFLKIFEIFSVKCSFNNVPFHKSIAFKYFYAFGNLNDENEPILLYDYELVSALRSIIEGHVPKKILFVNKAPWHDKIYKLLQNRKNKK